MLSRKCFYAVLLGNILENYDRVLYHLLVPCLAPLFFANFDPLTALAILFLPLGFLTKPIGALIFGYIGDRFGRKRALFGTIIGMSITTGTMGFLPTYHTIGITAPILLILCRMLQDFFSAGESTGGTLLLFENSHTQKKELLSSIYSASSIMGYFIASLAVFLIGYLNFIENGWRYLCFLGTFTGIFGFIIRSRCSETFFAPKEKILLKQIFKKNSSPLIAVTLVSAFSYTTYALSIPFMSGFLPQVSSLTISDILGMNTALLLLDMLLLPCFGYLAFRFSKEKIMKISLYAIICITLPMFSLLKNVSFTSAALIRICFVTIGVAFSAPYYYWAKEAVPKECRYTVISLGKAIGGGLIGASTTSISLWLYQKTGWILAPGLYVIFMATLAWIGIRMAKKAAAQNPIKDLILQ